MMKSEWLEKNYNFDFCEAAEKVEKIFGSDKSTGLLSYI